MCCAWIPFGAHQAGAGPRWPVSCPPVLGDWHAGPVPCCVATWNQHGSAWVGMPSAPASFRLQPIEEQHAIADFLDRETAKIDGLVARKERLIELLQEKRTALITRAVTRGLDPDVPMKDSGVEWLGEIPANTGKRIQPCVAIVSKFARLPRKDARDRHRFSDARLAVASIGDVQEPIKVDFSNVRIGRSIPEDLYPQWMVRGRPERRRISVLIYERKHPSVETSSAILDADDEHVLRGTRRIADLLKVNATRITNVVTAQVSLRSRSWSHGTLYTRRSWMGYSASTGSRRRPDLKASLHSRFHQGVCNRILESTRRTVDSGTVDVELC